MTIKHHAGRKGLDKKATNVNAGRLYYEDKPHLTYGQGLFLASEPNEPFNFASKRVSKILLQYSTTLFQVYVTNF